MAQCIIVPSCTGLQPQWRKKYFLIQTASNVLHCRRRISALSRAELTFELNACHFGGHSTTLTMASHNAKIRPTCSATMSNLGYTLDWASYMDEVLFVISVIFAYLAGVIPHRGFDTSRREIKNGSISSISHGSDVKGRNEGSSKNIWSEMEEKIKGALNAVDIDYTVDRRGGEAESDRNMHLLSLCAIDQSPRFRLLAVTLEQVRKKVLFIAEVHEGADMDARLVVSSKIISDSIQPIFLTWLEVEISRRNIIYDKDLVKKLLLGFKDGDAITRKIQNSGKEHLYADLIFYLRFGALRTYSKYDSKFLDQHRTGILEDLVVSLADGIANMFLKLISVDSNMCAEMNCIGLTVCSMSTRALQKMRNEVSFSRWLYQNVESVVAIYEDRFDLFTLQTKPLMSTEAMQTKSLNWWKELIFWQPRVRSPLSVQIAQISLPVKRTMELRALTGWRYYFSLFLEFADVAMPVVNLITSKINSGVSFFLTCLIGRSLGLIYTGIRQALRWK